MTTTRSKYHPRYIERLAAVYMDKHHSHGYDAALLWYHGFVPPELQERVKQQVQQLVAGAPKNGGKN